MTALLPADDRLIVALDVPNALAGLGLAALADPRWTQAVEADWRRSAQLELVAAPTFYYEGRRLVGCVGTERLERLLDGGGDAPRGLTMLS